MTTFVLFGSFILFLMMTIPIGVAIGLAVILTAIQSENVSITFFAQGLVTSTDNFALMAVPFFILAGEIMGKGGISRRLFDFVEVFVGRFTGGLAMAAVIVCMFFAAISGSGPATVAAVGGMMIPIMIERGYSARYATAVIATAGSLGIIIPPSIPLVLFGVSSGQSIGDLFMAGINPGIVLGLFMMVWAYITSKKRGYKGTGEKFSWKRMLKGLNEAKWSLLVPVIILGGIYGGIFTPTEAAVVAVVYALIVSLLLHRELSFNDLPKVIGDAALNSVVILFIIGTANAFGTVLTMERIPQAVANAFLSISENPTALLILITILLLIVGCFMDTSAAVIIFTPILLPVALQIGIDPIFFGAFMIVTLAIGFITPPFGVNLFVGSGISGVSMPHLIKEIVPWIIVLILALIVIILVPEITLLWL